MVTEVAAGSFCALRPPGSSTFTPRVPAQASKQTQPHTACVEPAVAIPRRILVHGINLSLGEAAITLLTWNIVPRGS